MGSTSLIPIIHFKNSRASYFLRPENFLSLLSMRKGPNCPVPNTKFKQGKESVETGSPAAVPWSEDSRTPISNSSFVWCLLRFLYPEQSTRVRTVLGKRCAFLRWERMTVEKVGRRNHQLGGGGLRIVNFREVPICEVKNVEIDSFKTIHTCILHRKSSCIPRGLYIPMLSDLG